MGHNFSAPKTYQQNGGVERKNRTLEEMARMMLIERGVPKRFWGEVVNTASYILNRALITPKLNKTPYELLKVPILHTLVYLDAIVLCIIMGRTNLISSNLGVTRQSFLDILLIAKDTRCSIRGPCVLRKVCM